MNQKNNASGNQKAQKDHLLSYKSLLNLDNAVNKRNVVANKAAVEKRSKKIKRSRSRSPSLPDNKKSRSFNKTESIKDNLDIPDRSYGDLYCKACDSHMNSEDMWSMHLQGKRHLKNTKSSPVELEADRKYDYVDEDPKVQAVIDDESSPIIGLKYICELQREEQKPSYTCFICSSTIPNSRLLLEHLLGWKHRMAFLKEHDPQGYNLIQESNLKKGQIESVVEELVQKHESTLGRGKMTVKREKLKSTYTWSSKKTVKEYHNNFPSHGSKREDRDFWVPERKHTFSHSVDYGHGERKRQYSSSSSSLDSYYAERVTSKLTGKEQPYAIRESSRNEDLSYYRPTASESELSDRNYHLSRRANDTLSDVSGSRFGDLREFLEKKKTPSLDSNIPDEVLGIISALPTISFLQLVLFKLDDMKVEDEVEIKFLDRVVNRATTLLMTIKSKLLTPSLRQKFKESMVQNGIDVENDAKKPSKDVQNLLDMLGECKAMSSMSNQDVSSAFPQNNSLSMPSKYLPQPKQTYTTVSNPTSSYSSYSSLSSYSTKPVILGTRSELSYEHFDQNPHKSPQNSHLPAQNPAPFISRYSSSYNSPCSIPGLTLTQDNFSLNKQSTSSPFDKLEAQVENIFGIDQWSVKEGKTTKYI